MSVVKIRHLIEKKLVEIRDLEERLKISTTTNYGNIKNKITFCKAEISSLQKKMDSVQKEKLRMPIRDTTFYRGY